GDQPTLAVVTDTRAARPPDRNVAGLRELEEALLVRRAPSNGETAPGEGHQGPRSGNPRRWMRRSHRGADHTRRQRGETGEDLGVDPIAEHAPGGQASPQVGEKARRPAEVEVGLARNAKPVEGTHPQPALQVVVLPFPVVRIWLAVPNATSAVGEAAEKLP